MTIDLTFGSVDPQTSGPKRTNFEDILAKAKAILHPEYLQVERKFYFIEPLIPSNYIFQDIIVNLYEELPPVGAEYPQNVSVVLHGHDRASKCYSTTFCHVHGYSPTGAESPTFITLFKQKWSQNDQ